MTLLAHIATKAALAAEQASARFWEEQYRETAAELDQAQQRVAELEGRMAAAASVPASASKIEFHVANAYSAWAQRTCVSQIYGQMLIDEILRRLRLEGLLS